jgi:hypothetical protein
MDMEQIVLDKNQWGGYMNNFEQPGGFVFEFRAPDGREFCVKYRHVCFNKYSTDGYRLDHITKWADPKSKVDLSADGIISSPEEANAALRETGHTVDDVFVYMMEKNIKRKVRRKARLVEQN